MYIFASKLLANRKQNYKRNEYETTIYIALMANLYYCEGTNLSLSLPFSIYHFTIRRHQLYAFRQRGNDVARNQRRSQIV